MNELLSKVKENLILEHDADDKLLERYITAAIYYADIRRKSLKFLQ